jgi:hypothetical protein
MGSDDADSFSDTGCSCVSGSLLESGLCIVRVVFGGSVGFLGGLPESIPTLLLPLNFSKNKTKVHMKKTRNVITVYKITLEG